MVCPGCKSIIPQIDTELIVTTNMLKSYEHTCSRCYCKILVTIEILSEGNPELIEKYKNWINEGRK